VLINNVLVPIRLLTNGTTVAQLCNDRVRYFHVELPRHAVIFAEGLTVESYLDTGDRVDFTDAATIRLHPVFDGAPLPDTALLWETRGAAKLVTAGLDLATARGLVRAAVPEDPRTGAVPRPGRQAA